MKKISYITFGILLSYSPLVSAIPAPEDLPATSKVPTNLAKGIATVSDTILLIIGTIAVLMLIIGGFQYVTSAGNPESIGKAKSTILYAILGIVFAILAWAIISYITGQLIA